MTTPPDLPLPLDVALDAARAALDQYARERTSPTFDAFDCALRLANITILLRDSALASSSASSVPRAYAVLTDLRVAHDACRKAAAALDP